MGYWDGIFSDASKAIEWASSWMPDDVLVAGVPVPREALAQTAFGTPYSIPGLLLKAGVALQQSGANQAQISAAVNGITGIASAAGPGGITIGVPANMAQLIIPNVYRCAIEMVAGGRAIVNVIHVEGSSSGQQAAAAAAVLAAWKVANGPLSKLSSLVAMTEVSAMDLSSSSGGITVLADTTAGGQSSTNALATRGACALIKWNGGTRSRTSRGRLYYGPIMETNIDADGASIAAASNTIFSTAFTNFRSSLTAANFTLGVASRLSSTFTSVGSHTVETTIATQRRRIRS